MLLNFKAKRSKVNVTEPNFPILCHGKIRESCYMATSYWYNYRSMPLQLPRTDLALHNVWQSVNFVFANRIYRILQTALSFSGLHQLISLAVWSSIVKSSKMHLRVAISIFCFLFILLKKLFLRHWGQTDKHMQTTSLFRQKQYFHLINTFTHNPLDIPSHCGVTRIWIKGDTKRVRCGKGLRIFFYFWVP